MEKPRSLQGARARSSLWVWALVKPWGSAFDWAQCRQRGAGRVAAWHAVVPSLTPQPPHACVHTPAPTHPAAVHTVPWAGPPRGPDPQDSGLRCGRRCLLLGGLQQTLRAWSPREALSPVGESG